MRSIESLGGKTIPNYKGPVVFHHGAAVDLLGILANSFRGDVIAKHKSLIAAKKGQKFYSDQLCLLDDALMQDGVGSGLFDDEGTPHNQTTLVQEGLPTT